MPEQETGFFNSVGDFFSNVVGAGEAVATKWFEYNTVKTQLEIQKEAEIRRQVEKLNEEYRPQNNDPYSLTGGIDGTPLGTMSALLIAGGAVVVGGIVALLLSK